MVTWLPAVTLYSRTIPVVNQVYLHVYIFATLAECEADVTGFLQIICANGTWTSDEDGAQ